MFRPGWTEYFLGIAEAVAARADCTRRQAGTVIVRDHRILASGYNGAPAGVTGCLEGACPRGRHYPANGGGEPAYGPAFRCGCGAPWPCPDAVAPTTTSYDAGPGICMSIHSEANAIIYADGMKIRGADLYTVPGEPCAGCWKLIHGAGIASVYWPGNVIHLT